jgi:RND superfamily putative drug exporter
MAALVKYFVSDDGKSTRLTIVLKARPYSDQANADVRKLQPAVEAAARSAGFSAVVAGTPVVMNDIQQTLTSDFRRIGAYTIIGVFIVLALLLRSLVAPIYLVLTVLLSYGTTMALSTLVFQDLLGHEGVNYFIPIVVFVLLVALGADYNIFLMSRVREEAVGRGTREGIRVASAFTGSIITSCGIILAGTFAAMMVAPIQTMFQIGFSVAAGVLIDTFIIRAVLVPAIASILGERNWLPGKIGK